jgi:hypothetical protein
MTPDAAIAAYQAAIAAYRKAHDAADEAYGKAIGPARQRWERVIRECRQAGVKIPADELAAWMAAQRRARTAYRQIITGPRADADRALSLEGAP